MIHTYFIEQWECKHGIERSVAFILYFSFKELKVIILNQHILPDESDSLLSCHIYQQICSYLFVLDHHTRIKPRTLKQMLEGKKQYPHTEDVSFRLCLRWETIELKVDQLWVTSCLHRSGTPASSYISSGKKKFGVKQCKQRCCRWKRLCAVRTWDTADG